MPSEMKAIYARTIRPILEPYDVLVIAVKGSTNQSDVSFDENGTARFYHGSLSKEPSAMWQLICESLFSTSLANSIRVIPICRRKSAAGHLKMW